MSTLTDIVPTPILLALLTVLLGLAWRFTSKPRLPLPPGPPGLPILGNLFDMPKEYDWLHYASLHRQYGPINALTALGQTIIVLNSAPVISDLMEKRQAIYSDRPQMRFSGELVGWNATLGATDYGELFRAQRRAMHRVMGSSALVGRFAELLDVEAKRFVGRVLGDVSKWEHFVRMETGAIILKLTYGYTPETDRPDPMVNLADKTMYQFSLAAQPAAWAVNSLPILRYVPTWFPGAGFKRTAAEWRKTLYDLIDIPFDWVKEQVAKGNAYPSMVSNALEDNPSPEDVHSTRMAAMAMFTGGSDTTVSAIRVFILNMLLHPHIQSRAQAEIDRIVGSDRLPRFEDREKLPYIEAVLKEVLRWGVVAPMGLPHALAKEDTYLNYRLPARSLVVANIWNVLHDPETYKDPEEFRPERFVPGVDGEGGVETDPKVWCFGFGRRVCPGKELADAQLFITIATVLATLNIAPVRDENGKEVLPETRMSSGVISHPPPFAISATPRSTKALALLNAANDEHPFQGSDAEELYEALRLRGSGVYKEGRGM